MTVQKAKVAGVGGGQSEVLAKAIGPDGDAAQSNQPQWGYEDKNKNKWFEANGSVPVPYDPIHLVNVFERSNCLRQMVDAYAVNVYGTGWQIEPVVDVTDEQLWQEIADAMYAERIDEWLTEGGEGNPPEEPTDEEVEQRIEELRIAIKRENFIAQAFFQSCSTSQSFVSLCRLTGTDKETSGNAFWECLRDGMGRLTKLEFMSSVQTRLASIHPDFVDVDEWRYVSSIKSEAVKVKRRFRRFLMEIGGRIIWFKEFGDPRILSAKTGKFYEDLNEWKRDDQKPENDTPATEVLHFRVPSVRSPYGIPRWIGVMTEILGSMATGEINIDYFDSKTVPPMIISVSGGQLTEGSRTQVEDFFTHKLKDRKNFHAALLLQALPNRGIDGKNSDVKFDVKPLAQYIEKDALFQGYDQNNVEKIGAAFRLPQLLRGIVKDVNRSSAKATLQFAEEQVFGPERLEFDWIINNLILRDLGLNLVRFRSNGVQTSDPASLAEILNKVLTAGGITINEARSIMSQIFKKNFPTIDEFWANQPLEITKMGILPEDAMPLQDVNATEDGQGDEENATQGDSGSGKTDIAAILERLNSVVNQVKQAGVNAETIRQKNATERTANTGDLDEAVEE